MEKETQTTTSAKTWGGNFQDFKECHDDQENYTENVVATPIFIIFAEYLGYLSQFNKKAEEWCDGKIPEVHVQKIMILEAKCILRQMKKDYGIDEIKYYYDCYYPLILKEYADKLEKIIEG